MCIYICTSLQKVEDIIVKLSTNLSILKCNKIVKRLQKDPLLI